MFYLLFFLIPIVALLVALLVWAAKVDRKRRRGETQLTTSMQRHELSGGTRNDGPPNGAPEPNTEQAGQRGLPARRRARGPPPATAPAP